MWLKTSTRSANPRALKIAKILAAAVAMLAILLVIASVFYRHDYSKRPRGFARIALTVQELPGRLQYMFKHPSALETLRIDIKFRHWQKIVAKREHALRRKILVTAADDEVPAKFSIQGRTVKAKLRLKGDWTDHLEDKTGWSFRVKVRGKGHIRGLRRFSLQMPKTRYNDAEPLILDHFRDAGLLAPRYSFVKVVVNGADWGVMALEEHFSKELLESQGRKDGVIGRLDETRLWAQKVAFRQFYPYGNPYTSPYKAFGRNKLMKKPALAQNLKMAESLFAALQAGRLKAEDIFNIDLVARYFVISELWDNVHGLASHNQRFYLDPYRLRVEPVVYDNIPHLLASSAPVIKEKAALDRALLHLPAMKVALARNMALLLPPIISGEYPAILAQKQRRYMGQMAFGNLFLRPKLHLENLGRKARLMMAQGPEFFVTEAAKPDAEHGPDKVRGYLENAQLSLRFYDNGKVEIGNLTPRNLHLKTLELTRYDAAAKAHVSHVMHLDSLLPAVPFNDRAPLITVDIPGRFLDGPLTYRVDFADAEGKTQRHQGENTGFLAYLTERPLSEYDISDGELAAQPWFDRLDDAGDIHLKPGDWLITRPVVFPAGRHVTVPAGSNYRFSQNSFWIVQGALSLGGNVEHPVRFSPVNAAEGWKGLFIRDAGAKSRWRHGRIENSRSLATSSLALTGGVTFLNSPVDMAHMVFDGTTAEDALNIVGSEFEISHSRFANTRSDALDADFSNGTFKDGRLEDIGGDGIDVSGAVIEINDTVFSRVHDKAVSIGEASRADISGLKVNDSGVAVAVKDGSSARIRGAVFTDLHYAAVMAYRKKPEYGLSDIVAEDIEFKDTAREMVADTSATITYEGRQIPSVDMDVDALYKTGPMKK